MGDNTELTKMSGEKENILENDEQRKKFEEFIRTQMDEMLSLRIDGLRRLGIDMDQPGLEEVLGWLVPERFKKLAEETLNISELRAHPLKMRVTSEGQ
ncbi:MAG: hypothetical protein WAN11_20125 [Syntrophobacteraceae bacterium]